MARKGDLKVGADAVLVVSLGLFGSAVALALAELEVEVLAIASDSEQVAKYADDLTHVIEMDSTDREALEQIGVSSFTTAVVGLSDVEKSIMTVLALSEAGVPDIWARAATLQHGSILERIGAHHVIYSERSTGRRVAHAVAGTMDDYFEFEHGFAMARTSAPRSMWNQSIREAQVRMNHQVTVAGARHASGHFNFVDADTVIMPGDELIVSGTSDKVEAFCRQR